MSISVLILIYILIRDQTKKIKIVKNIWTLFKQSALLTWKLSSKPQM